MVPAMRLFARLAAAAALLTLWIVGWPAVASAAPAEDGLRLDLRTAESAYGRGEPVRLMFAVTNGSGAPCGLSTTVEGTVQVTSVRRDGQELVPALGRSFYLDGLTSGIRASLVTAAPGSTVDVAVPTLRLDDGQDPGSVVLRSVAGTPDGGGLDSLWPVGKPGRYEVTATYAVL
ncbi:MAG: hypothetical protein QOE61_1233, partial [Micromonosporaceae bacterium]|nr:hypothetical protein [Micromonosporaceae bacterium]